MNIQNSFFLTILECIRAAFKVGVVTSFTLCCIVMLLSKETQATSIDNNQLINQEEFSHPGDVKRGTLLFKGEKDF